MYIEQDFVGPATLDLQANRKMHNRLLRYWPTKVVNGVVVLDRLYLYNGTVQESDSHKKIYNILGVSLEDLKAEKWKGIQNYYMYFNVLQGDYDDLTNLQLDTYLQFQAPFTEKSVPEATEFDRSLWLESELSYEPSKVDALSNALSDSEIIAKVIADPYVVEYSIEDEHVLTSLALLDVNSVIFERELKVTYRGLTDVTTTAQTSVDNTASFVKEVNIEFRFRRKPEASQAVYEEYLAFILSNITASQYNVTDSSLQLQLLEVYRSMVPFIDSDILYTDGFVNPETGYIVGSAYYRLDGLQAMKSKEFNKTITGRIKTGYKKKKVKAWKKFVTVLVEVLIYVAYALSGFNPVVLTIGSLVMYALAYVMAKHDPAWAAYIGKSAQRIGTVALIATIYDIAQNYVREAGAEAIKEMTAEEIKDALIAAVKDSFAGSTSLNMQNVLSWATKGFQAYIKYIDPADKDLDEMSELISWQEEQIEDLSSAGLKDKIDYMFSSPFYNIYDFNEIMQAVPYTMTQGKVDATFNKYYDGVASKVTYRGYLG